MTGSTRQLDGKVALVTGAGRGIGKAIALAYASEGAAVCCAARTPGEIEQTVREIVELGSPALAVPTDVTKLDSVDNLFRQAKDRLGGLDIVVLNAGGNLDGGHVENGDAKNWVATIELNLIGAYYCARAAIPYLKERGAGKIITIGSGMGHNGSAGSSAYACSKAGLWMLTRVLAQELWEHNISVNELVPGPVDTSLTKDAVRTGDSVFGIGSEWVKTPDDVAPLAVFLATQPDRGPTAQSYSLMRRDG